MDCLDSWTGMWSHLLNNVVKSQYLSPWHLAQFINQCYWLSHMQYAGFLYYNFVSTAIGKMHTSKSRPVPPGVTLDQ